MELDSTVSCKLQQSVDSHVEKLNYSVVKSVRRCQPFIFIYFLYFFFITRVGFSVGILMVSSMLKCRSWWCLTLTEKSCLLFNFATASLAISSLLVKQGHPEKQPLHHPYREPGSVASGKHPALKLPNVPL